MPTRGRAGDKKYTKIVRNQLQEKQVGKYLDDVKNDKVTKLFVSNSILLFDDDSDFSLRWSVKIYVSDRCRKDDISGEDVLQGPNGGEQKHHQHRPQHK